jgi:hypothetical protein
VKLSFKSAALAVAIISGPVLATPAAAAAATHSLARVAAHRADAGHGLVAQTAGVSGPASGDRGPA